MSALTVKLALLRPLPVVGGILVGMTGLRTWFTQHGYVVVEWPVPDVVLWVVGWLLLIVPLVMIRDLTRVRRSES